MAIGSGVVAAFTYREAIALVKIWPKRKIGRDKDLSDHLRRLVATSFPHGETSAQPGRDVNKELHHMRTLAKNVHLNDNPRVFPEATSTGIKKEHLEEIVQTDFLKKLQEAEENISWWDKLRGN